MYFTTVLLATIAVEVFDPGRPACKAGDPMVVTVGNDVGWQVLSLEERARLSRRGANFVAVPTNG